MDKLAMDKLISKIAAFGVPGLVLTVAISATGLTGGAAIVAALAALGPGGIIGGLVTLFLIASITEGISEFGFSAVFSGVVKQLYKQGETKSSIQSKINKYPISNSLKRKLNEELNRL